MVEPREVPVIVIVDQNISREHPQWKEETRNLVEHEAEYDLMVAYYEVVYRVSDQIVVEFPQDAGLSEVDRNRGFHEAIEKEIKSSKGQKIIVFTENMSPGFQTEYIGGGETSYIMENYSDYAAPFLGIMNDGYYDRVRGDMHNMAPSV